MESDIILTMDGLIALALLLGYPLLLALICVIGSCWRIEKLEAQLAEAQEKGELE
jgi:hypothetical protein